jgi:hypothetical protein
MKGRRLRFVNTQLNNWDIGIWIHVPKHGPCPVIESPWLSSFTGRGASIC